MKNVFLTAILVLSTTSAVAAPVSYKPLSTSQPDGNRVELFVSGDEFYRYVHDENGFPVVRDDDGWLVYVQTRADVPVPSSIPAGIGDPLIAGLTIEPGPPHTDRFVRDAVDSGRETLRRIREESGAIRPRLGGPFRGTINELVVFVRFAGEEEFTDDLAFFDEMFNATGPDAVSMDDYYTEASYGRLSVKAHFFPLASDGRVASYEDTQPRRYFQWASQRNPDGYHSQVEGYSRLSGMLDRALEYVKSQVPGDLDLDLDNDGFAENVVFVVSGDADEWADILWPHMSILMNDEIINGARLFQYNLQFRDWLMERSVGVLAHEFFHAIGAPDLYHYSHDEITPAGRWDVMERTAEPPQHMMAWMKHRYGFFIDDVPFVTEPGRYTLNPLTEETDNCLRIMVPGEKYQYVVVEYRRRSGKYESGLPEDGLLVYRVDEEINGNASGPPDEVYIFRPGGEPDVDGDIDDAAFNGLDGRTLITSTTDPYMFRQNLDSIGIRIYDISEPVETISFSVCPEVPSCLGLECGDDGCGGSCGSCDDDNPCTTDNCVDGRCEFVPVAEGTSCEDGQDCSGAGTCDAAGVCVADVPSGCVDGDDCTMDLCFDGGQWLDIGENRFEDIMKLDAGDAGIDGDQIVVGGVPIGFEFPFYGRNWSWLKVYDNGLVQFSSDGAVSEQDLELAELTADNVAVPTEDGLENILAVFWDNLVCRLEDRCVVAYTTLGDAEELRLIVQFNKIQRVSMPGRLFNFQVALFVDGRIEYRYGDMGSEDGMSATIGFEGVDGQDGSQFSFKERVVRSGMTISYAPGAYQCVNRPRPGFCHIDGECVAAATPEPGNPCRECRPLVDFGGYSDDDSNFCTDGDECTRVDRCVAGSCIGEDVVVCKATNQCYFPGTCDPLTGLCDETLKDDGTRCNADNDGCTVGDYCVGGECLAGPGADCSSKNAECAVGICKSRSSNSFRCEADSLMMAGQPCGDGPDECSLQDSCDDRGNCLPNHRGSDVVCRPSTGDCDLAEYCDGAGGCPKDEYMTDGAVCGWMDGYSCSHGRCLPEVTGDLCEQAVGLTVGQARRGSVGTASVSGGSASDSDCASNLGPDVYYRLELVAGRTYSISVEPVGDDDFSFGLIERCGQDVCPSLVDNGGVGDSESIEYLAEADKAVLLRVIGRQVDLNGDFVVSVVDTDAARADDVIEPADVAGTDLDGVSGASAGGCSQAAGSHQSPFHMLPVFMMLACLIFRSWRRVR